MAPRIVRATRKSLAEIEAWLKTEEAEHERIGDLLAEDWTPEVELPTRGFLCNWNIVVRAFRQDADNVHVLMVEGAAVGFLCQMDILEVRPDLRRKGYGELLAEFMVARAFERGHSVAEIEIAPESAVPFWTRMGFTPVSGRRGPGGGEFAFRLLPRRHHLGDLSRLPYRIAFYPTQRAYDPSVDPFAVFEGLGERLPNGDLQLPERAFGFAPHIEQTAEIVVSIEVAGVRLAEGRVRHNGPRTHGMTMDDGGIFYIDAVTAIPANVGQSG